MFSRGKASALLLVLVATQSAAEPPERDPMRPFGRIEGVEFSTAAAPRFTLTAVVISPTRRVAVINGKPCLPGDVVNCAELVAIEHDSVRMRDRNGDVVISLARAQSERPRTQGAKLP